MRFPRLAIFAFASISFGCAHYPDVRPDDTGINSVIFRTERKGEGFREAWSQAKSYCDDVYKNFPYKVKETSNYVGNMDESTYNAAKTGSKVATGVGAAAAIFGGKNESKAGVGVGLGGGIADSALGQDYEYTLTFKCK
ncbi:MAG: hypothetical protein V4655_10050 [Bdellovibrionota bacterium]|nr:MAG: hypothetical protein EOP10_10785 [Pseudomonadota bacterium]